MTSQRFAGIFSITKIFEMKYGSNKRFNSSVSGFTLIEMLVVVSVIGILVTLAGYNNAKVLKSSKDAALKVELSQIREAVYRFALNNSGKFPENLENLKGEELKTVPENWSGSNGKGKYHFEPVTGVVSLFEESGDNPSDQKDISGNRYGDY